ncbi:DUF4760 domain-containing protein, partial [Escherichia coli]|nr:DUF4760 domain-containing protein [Escherichia coli]MDW6907852.1 DUF4760 domain-containing protein [Escherichia coli]
MNPITLQIISNAIVLLGVLVAIGTIIYNVRTAKKTQTANFLFESRQDMQYIESLGNDSNLLIVFYVQIMPDDFVMQLHR